MAGVHESVSGEYSPTGKTRKSQQGWGGRVPLVVSVCTLDEPLTDVCMNECLYCGLKVSLTCYSPILVPSTQGWATGPSASGPFES